MRLPKSSTTSHRIKQNQNSLYFNNDMSPSSVCSIELPYLGAIFLGKSPLNLTSFQKPLRELYLPYYQKDIRDERRIIISDYDILIFEPDKAVKGKRSFIYSNFESIVDIQLLKLSIRTNNTENQSHKRMQTAFLPIGCERQERFRSLYSTINKTQYNILSTSTSYHPSLLVFIIRKPGLGNSSSLLDCHVFIVYRESIGFELCEMIRKLIVRQTMSPFLSKKLPDDQIESKTNNDLVLNVNLNDVVHSLPNPFSSSSVELNNVQHSSSSSSLPPPTTHDTSKVLTMNSDIHRMSSQQRHFIKTSTIIQDESDEILNDLMSIVANEKLKSQGSIKRHASFDQISYSDENKMNKKRYFHNKKRLLNPIPITHNTPQPPQKVHSMIEGHLLRPHIVINRYGDIGNYVPKFLRETNTTRSSDSNENFFFRSTNGQIINGFLKLDFLSSNKTFNEKNLYQSTPCLNQDDQNIYSLVQQLQKNRHQYESNRMSDIEIHQNNNDDDHRVPHIQKSPGDNNKILPLSSKPKRIASSSIADKELPIDYRQYLRHTDQGAYLYGEEQRQQKTLEHSLGYLP